jgi:hypothetical protein
VATTLELPRPCPLSRDPIALKTVPQSAPSEPRQEPVEVLSFPSTGSAKDRAERIGRILAKITEYEGKDAATTIIEDERANLASFAESEDCDIATADQIGKLLK